MRGGGLCVIALADATNTWDYLFSKLVVGSEETAQKKPHPGNRLVRLLLLKLLHFCWLIRRSLHWKFWVRK